MVSEDHKALKPNASASSAMDGTFERGVGGKAASSSMVDPSIF
jgi:hypothetical protein